MTPQPSLGRYLMLILRRSLANWHGLDGWMAIISYFALAGLTLLATDSLAGVLEEGFSAFLSYVLAGWLVLLLFVIAPYWVWRDSQTQVLALEGRLTPRMLVETRGTNIVKTIEKPSGKPGPDSKWMQITISSLSDEPLHRCQVYCSSIERLTGGPQDSLLSEPLWCPWSNVSDATKELSVPGKIHQAVNVFTSYKGDESLQLQFIPPKVGISEEMQMRGDYRMNFVATSDGIVSQRFTCLFHWNGYDDVYLAKE